MTTFGLVVFTDFISRAFFGGGGPVPSSSSSLSSWARFFPLPVGALAEALFALGALVALALAEALALAAPLVKVLVAVAATSGMTRAFFVDGPAISSALRLVERREGPAVVVVTVVVETVVVVEVMVVAAPLAFAVFVGFTRKTRLDGSTTRIPPEARVPEGAIEASIASPAV